jgi:hypothetical protein
MREWLTIEVALGTLLVTSFTCVGLVALWAATSPRHWFLRTAVVVAFLSPLLLIPACEPFLTFMIQAGIVVGGVIAWRRATFSRNRNVIPPFAPSHYRGPKSVIRYSLTTLLLLAALACVTVAVATRIATNLPPQNREAWTTIALDGLLCGSAVLIGAWMFASARKWWAWPTGIIACLLAAALLTREDWLVLSWTWLGDWPPDNATVQRIVSSYGIAAIPHTARIWYGVLSAIVSAVIVVCSLWKSAISDGGYTETGRDQIRGGRSAVCVAARAGLCALLPFIGVFPSYVLWNLCNPPRMPQVTIPVPNGYDDVISAGRTFGQSQILNMAVDPNSTDELAAEVAKYVNGYRQLRLGMSREIQADVWPPVGDRRSAVNATQSESHCAVVASRALSREAELAQQQQRFPDAAEISIEEMRFGQAYARAGLLRHFSVGIAIEGVGQYTLYPTITHLDATACRHSIAELEELDNLREPFDLVRQREQVWEQNAFGWHNRVGWILYELVGSNAVMYEYRRNTDFTKCQAISRLLIVELAIRAFQFERGALPENLDQLMPANISAVPLDPYDPGGGRLKYLRTDNGHILYSFGSDKVDDGGQPLTEDLSYKEHGDLRLDMYYAAHENTNSAANGDGSPEADSEGADTKAAAGE